MKKAKHLAEEYSEKAVNKVKSVRDEGKERGFPGFMWTLFKQTLGFLFLLVTYAIFKGFSKYQDIP